ncbi:MAG: glycoside hydrolase family 25 [Bacteroidota bacterium]|nr:glycoside hydrolase family 25 [Bacteroidota bacterium]
MCISVKKHLLCVSILVIFSLAIAAQTILGVDVSHYDSDPPYGTINWVQAKTAGKTFAFCKATEGVTYTDPSFVTNISGGNIAGVVMGAYHFARPETNTAINEANYFLSKASSYIGAGYLPPVLDLEDPSGTPLSSFFTSNALTMWVQDWMSTVENATGVAPVIYTNGTYASYLNSSLNTYGLWTADPDGSATAAPNAAHLGVWTTWLFKQYSWTGTVSGIGGNSSAQVDLDVYHGNTNSFDTLIGGGIIACTPPATPVAVSPGTASGPGSSVTSAPLQWNASTGAISYYPRISQCPYGAPNIIWYDTCHAGTTETAALASGNLYRWNMAAYSQCGNPGCESGGSNTLYFNIPPVLTSGNASFCQGDSVALHTTAGNTVSTAEFHWYLNGNPVDSTGVGTFYAKQQGTYTAAISYACGITGTSNAIVVNVTALQSAAVSIATADTNLCSGASATFTSLSANGGNSPMYNWYVNGNVAGSGTTFTLNNIQNNSTVYCRMTSSATCISNANVVSDTITVQVNPLPVADAGPTVYLPSTSSDTIGGNSTATNGTSPYTYLWSPAIGLSSISIANPVVSGINSNTFYTLTIIDSKGCSNTDTVSVYVINCSLTAPTVQVNFCELTAQNLPAISYQWYLQGSIINGATTRFYSVSQSGNYSVKVIDSVGCTALSPDVYINYPGCISTGVEATLNGLQFDIYPNPANEEITVSLGPFAGSIDLEILDLTGQINYQCKGISASKWKINTKGLSPGAYILRGTTIGGKFAMKTFVKL